MNKKKVELVPNKNLTVSDVLKAKENKPERKPSRDSKDDGKVKIPEGVEIKKCQVRVKKLTKAQIKKYCRDGDSDSEQEGKKIKHNQGKILKY